MARRPRTPLLPALVATLVGCGEATPSPTAAPSPTPTSTHQAVHSPTPQAAAPASFPLGRVGCPMSHCDATLSDRVGLPAPGPGATLRWRDDAAAGSNYGLGCASNGAIAACSMGGSGGEPPYLKVYDADGAVLWTSDLLSWFSFSSAPMVSEEGGVIAADQASLVRFDPDGSVRWRTETPLGFPVSPVPVEGDLLVLASLAGPVSIYDAVGGALLDTLPPTGDVEGVPGFYFSRNTPVVRGRRIYVSTEWTPADFSGELPPEERWPARLYALDLDPAAEVGSRISVAWYHVFGQRSGSSPLLLGDTVYFDGDRLQPEGEVDPHVMAVVDRGDHGELRWASPLPGPGFASAAADPRGGLWVFGAHAPYLIRMAEEDGAELQRIDLAALHGEAGPWVPLSAMSVAEGPEGQPILLVTLAHDERLDSWLLAVDLQAEVLLWEVEYGQGAAGWGAGQFPIVLDAEGAPVVVFTTAAEGIVAVGAAP